MATIAPEIILPLITKTLLALAIVLILLLALKKYCKKKKKLLLFADLNPSYIIIPAILYAGLSLPLKIVHLSSIANKGILSISQQLNTCNSIIVVTGQLWVEQGWLR